jgi:pSer/pThr/pTyr-binding forkhead associated (FHA) protein
MPAFLVPVDSGQCLIPLEKAILLIGRQSDCDVALTQSRKISRKHCCIAQVNNKFVVRDLGSTNGVYLNGLRIQKEATLSIGDELVIGDVHYRMQNQAQLQSKPGPNRTPPSSMKTMDESTDVLLDPQLLPNRNRSVFTAAPSMDMPVPIREDRFDIKETSMNRHETRRHKRIDDVIPLNEVEEEDVIQLASDSF